MGGGNIMMDQTTARIITILIGMGIISIFGVFSLRDNPHREDWAVPNPLDRWIFPAMLGWFIKSLLQFFEKGWPNFLWTWVTSNPQTIGIICAIILFLAYIPWEKRRKVRARKFFGHT